MDTVTLGDLLAAAIPSGLMLYMLKSMADMKAVMESLKEKIGHAEEDISTLRKAKHDHANRLQELTSRVTLIEFQLKDDRQ